MMQAKAGIVRIEPDLKSAIEDLKALKARAENVYVDGSRQFNPGWHLAKDIKTLITISEALAKCALQREESRGGHTRLDFPEYDKHWSTVNSIVKKEADGAMSVSTTPLPQMPPELKKLFEEDKH